MHNESDVPRTTDEAARAMDRGTRNHADALHERVDGDFQYHPPRAGQPERYTQIREIARTMAHALIDRVPPGRELSTALTKLEECVMHGNAGIARHG